MYFPHYTKSMEIARCRDCTYVLHNSNQHVSLFLLQLNSGSFPGNAFLSWFIVIFLFDTTSPLSNYGPFGYLSKFGFVDTLSSAPSCSLKSRQHHTNHTLFSPCHDTELFFSLLGHDQKEMERKENRLRDDDQHASIPFQR